MPRCICDLPARCDGYGNLYCEGCGGDQCVCCACSSRGMQEPARCPGCDECGPHGDMDEHGPLDADPMGPY